MMKRIALLLLALHLPLYRALRGLKSGRLIAERHDVRADKLLCVAQKSAKWLRNGIRLVFLPRNCYNETC